MELAGAAPPTTDDLSAFGRAIADAEAPLEAYRALVAHALAAFPAANGVLLTRYEARSGLRWLVHLWSAGVEEDVARLPPRPLNATPNSEAIRTGAPVVVDDYDDATRGVKMVTIGLEQDPRRPGSALAVPVRARGLVVGCIELQSPHPRAFRVADAALLDAPAATLGLLLEAERLEETLRRALPPQAAREGYRPQEVERGLARRLLRRLADLSGARPQTLREMGRELAVGIHARGVEDHLRAYEHLGLGGLRLETGEGGRYRFAGRDLLETTEGQRTPRCFLTLGFLEGAVAAEHGEALGTELECASQGAPRCVFLVSQRPAPRR